MQFFIDFQFSETYPETPAVTMTLYTREYLSAIRTFKSNSAATPRYSYLISSRNNLDQLVKLYYHQ
jgi:hypothetical protein